MGSPCLGKRQGNLKRPDVNKVRYNLGYRLSHLIAIVSPSARSGGKRFGAWVSQRRCVSGGNGRGLIIRDLERDTRDLRRDREKSRPRQTDRCCKTLGISGAKDKPCSQPRARQGSEKLFDVTWSPTCMRKYSSARPVLNLHVARKRTDGIDSNRKRQRAGRQHTGPRAKSTTTTRGATADRRVRCGGAQCLGLA
jgi:hypothetical protein